MDQKIKNLYSTTLKEWEAENLKFFGLPTRENDFNDNYQEKLDKVCKSLWNNPKNSCVCKDYCLNCFPKDGTNVIIPFDKNDESSGFSLVEFPAFVGIYVWINNCGKKVNVPMLYLPIPTNNLTWIISGSAYIPRGLIKRNKESLTKVDDYVNHQYFKYNCSNGYKCMTFDGKKKYMELHPDFDRSINDIDFDDVVVSELLKEDTLSLMYLDAFLDGDFKIGESNEDFINHLNSLPKTDYQDMINYNYYDYHYFFNQIKKFMDDFTYDITKKPLRNVINCNSIIVKSGRVKTEETGTIREDTPDCSLILDGNSIFEISTFRSGVFFSNRNIRDFNFKNTELFFDAYKTPTSKSAGKVRTYLDDVFVKSGILYKEIEVNGKKELIDMYHARAKFSNGDTSMKTESLSSFSTTPFYNFNQPKRVMMTSKALAQAIPVYKETNDLTHEIPLRVVFGDVFGLNIAEGIVISESCAKKLVQNAKTTIYISTKNVEGVNVLKDMFGKDLKITEPKKISNKGFIKLNGFMKNDFLRYQNIMIHKIKPLTNSYNKNIVNGYKVFVTYQIPTIVGDKITNFHGSKGVITAILPDSQMPTLTKKVGNMKKGPFDVVVSSFSVVERGSIGQVVECLNSVFDVKDFNSLTEEQLAVYNEPVISFNGKLSSHCFGMQKFIRFCHLSVSHASFSNCENETKDLLNIGQQEKIFLYSQNFNDLFKEFKIRGNKIHNRKTYENELITTKKAFDVKTSMVIFSLIESLLGYNLNVNFDKKTFTINKVKIDDKKDVELFITKNLAKTTKINGRKVFSGGYGIYDQRLFNKRAYTCECGKTTKKDKVCPYCKTKADHKVKYYIKTNQFYPIMVADYSVFSKKIRADIQNLLEFKSFLYEGAVVNFDSKDKSFFSNFDDSKIIFGYDAVARYCKNISKETLDTFVAWADLNLTDKFIIQPLSERVPIIDKKGKIIKKEINIFYEKMIEENNKSAIFNLASNVPKSVLFSVYNKTYSIKHDVDEFLMKIINEGKNSAINKEGIAQKLSCCARQTLINAPFLDEDVVNIGLSAADDLYPEFTSLWSTPEELNYLISKGVLTVPKELYRVPDELLNEVFGDTYSNLVSRGDDFMLDSIRYIYPWRINSYVAKFYRCDFKKFMEDFKFFLIEQKINLWDFYLHNQSDIKYTVLVNRPPTICQLSFYSMFPIFGRTYTEEDMKKVETDISEIIKRFRESGEVAIEGYGFTFINENVNYNPDNPKEFCNVNDFDDEPQIEVGRSKRVWTDSRFESTAGRNAKETIEKRINIDCIGMNPIVYNGLNADVDGDLILVISVFSQEANKETLELLPSKNYKIISDNTVRNTIPADFAFVREN